jgi:polyisoprenoid-binding protein YceI
MLDRVPFRRLLMAMVVLSLGACAPAPRPDAGDPPRPAAATVPAGQSYEIVESDVTIRVYRDGPLARLGHNHVIASTGVTGRVVLAGPLSRSTLELSLPLDSLTVDEPARRAGAGSDFPDNVTEADREGTRRNMLGPALLDAANFPAVRLASVAVAEREDSLYVTTRVDVAGHVRELVVPVVLEIQGGTLVAHGEVTVTHAELGLVPFSVAMGALRVREDLQVAYRLVARKTST